MRIIFNKKLGKTEGLHRQGGSATTYVARRPFGSHTRHTYKSKGTVDRKGIRCNTTTSCNYMKLWHYIKDNEDTWSTGTDR